MSTRTLCLTALTVTLALAASDGRDRLQAAEPGRSSRLPRQLEQWQQDRENLKRFVNGVPHPKAPASFRKALGKLGHTERVQQVLAKTVPALESENFTAKRISMQIVGPDGALESLPPALAGSEGSPLQQAQQRFEESWAEAVETVTDARPVTASHLAQLRQALAAWERTADASTEGLSWFDRNRGRNYLQQVRGLIDLAADPRRRDSLAHSVASGGYAFPSGTIGTLAEHLLEHHLAVVPGTEAHRYLAELGRALDEAMDQEVREQSRLALAGLGSGSNRQAGRSASVSSATSARSSGISAGSSAFRTTRIPYWTTRTYHYWVPRMTTRTSTYRSTVPSTTRTYTTYRIINR